MEEISATWTREFYDDCASAKEALVDKFGKPHVQVNDMQTGLGIPVKQVEMVWTVGDGIATFSNPFSYLNDCFFIVMSRKSLNHNKEEQERQKEKF